MRIISRASARDIWTCVIDADHMPTTHVKGELIFDKLVHGTIITACAHSETRKVAGTCDG